MAAGLAVRGTAVAPRLLPGSPRLPRGRKQLPLEEEKGGSHSCGPLLGAARPDSGSGQGYQVTPRVTHTPGANRSALACCPQGPATPMRYSTLAQAWWAVGEA